MMFIMRIMYLIEYKDYKTFVKSLDCIYIKYPSTCRSALDCNNNFHQFLVTNTKQRNMQK